MFDVDPNEGLTLVEIAEGVTEDEVAKATGCSYKVPPFHCIIIVFSICFRLLTN